MAALARGRGEPAAAAQAADTIADPLAARFIARMKATRERAAAAPFAGSGPDPSIKTPAVIGIRG